MQRVEILQRLKKYKKLFDPVNNFAHFLLAENSNYLFAPHNLLLIHKLMLVEQGKIKRLIITMPPRHGKSHAVSRFGSWYFMKHPDSEVLLTSYSSTLAHKFSREARRAVINLGTTFGVKVSQEKSGVEAWELEGRRGIFFACSIGSSQTGKGAGLGIIDDPLKNNEEAFSKTVKEGIWDWYQSCFKTRLYPESRVILVLTRWAKDDLAGRLLEAMKRGEEDKWELLELKAVAEERDILGRSIGQALWEERFPLSYLLQVKNSMSSYFWSALYQQSPRPQEGGIFKVDWLKFYSNSEYVQGASFKTVMSIDPAISNKSNADYTVIMTVDVTSENNLIIRDVCRERIDFPSQLRLIEEKYKQYTPQVVLVEEVGFQSAIRQMMNKTGHFIPFKGVKQSKNKFLRINAMSPYFEQGRIFIKPDMRSFIDEYLDYPTSQHDDQLDALEMIIDYVAENYINMSDEPILFGRCDGVDLSGFSWFTNDYY